MKLMSNHGGPLTQFKQQVDGRSFYSVLRVVGHRGAELSRSYFFIYFNFIFWVNAAVSAPP